MILILPVKWSRDGWEYTHTVITESCVTHWRRSVYTWFVYENVVYGAEEIVKELNKLTSEQKSELLPTSWSKSWGVSV